MSQIPLTFEPIRQQAITVASDAIAMANDSSRDDPGVVHDLRVTCKKLRAWHRLMRSLLDKRPWQEADHRVRQVGRLLSPCRDRYVEHRTLEHLASLGSPTDKPFRHVATLQTQWAAVIEQTVQTQLQPDWEQINPLLKIEQTHWQTLTIPKISRTQQANALANAFKQTYRKARMLSRIAAVDPTIQTCHLWRKWAKHLLYQLSLLGDLAPQLQLDKSRSRLHAITNHLGDHHDFAMLARQLHNQADVLDALVVKRVLKLIRQQQKDHLKHAQKKARRVFAEKPGTWIRSLGE